MNKTKWPRGPYDWAVRDFAQGGKGWGGSISITDQLGFTHLLAAIPKTTLGVPGRAYPRTDAVVPLFAAAPEMYEALDDLSSAADLLQAACECATYDERTCVARVRTSLDTAIAALAKARGES